MFLPRMRGYRCCIGGAVHVTFGPREGCLEGQLFVFTREGKGHPMWVSRPNTLYVTLRYVISDMRAWKEILDETSF